MDKGKQIGKLLYFDPNNVTIRNDGDNISTIFNGLELIQTPEDYSIAVDLEVINKSRNNVVLNDQKMTFGMTDTKGTTNFLQGKNIENTNVLSTFFTDITYSGDEPNNVNEAMCINSIDIEFTSWYVASVIIKFTDVRGASLYSPSEYLNSENGNKKTPDGSIFSGFFTMPYPIFNLRIKGFYGNTVHYPLHLTDFKSEFDSEKGNVEITCHFIGYTYAMLNDVQVSYLLSAPNTNEGNAYWETQIKNGRFKTLEGNDLPKLPSLLKRIKDGEYAKTEINGNNANVLAVKELTEKETILKNIKTLIDEYVTALSKNYTVNNTGNKYILSITTKKTSPAALTKDMIGDELISNIINNLSIKVDEFKTLYPNDGIFTKHPNGINFFLLSLNSAPATSATLNLSDIVNKIDSYIKTVVYEKKVLGEQIASTVNNSLIEIYQMIPSIYNLTKTLLAHMETLLHVIGECANEVIKNERDKETLSNNQGTDIVNNKFSPFPWFTINNKDEWIGNYYPNIPEVKLVSSFIKAKTELSRELEKLETYLPTNNIAQTDTNLVVGDIWLPINAFDNSISKIGGKSQKPYSNINKTEATVDEIKALISTRLATIVGLSAELSNESYQSFIVCESRNIIDQLGKSFNSIQNVKLAINDIGMPISSNEMLKRNKYKLLTRYSVNSKNYYEYDLLNTGGLLPLNDDPIIQHQKHITNGAITNSNLKFYRPSNVTGNTNYNQYIPTNTIIIDGKNDCDKIYTDWYLRVKSLYDPKIDTDIEIMLKNYKLEKLDALYGIVDVNYEIQPLLNKIGYFKPEYNESGSNKIQIDQLNSYSGFKLDGSNKNIFNREKNMKFLNFFKAYLGKNTTQDVENLTINELSTKYFLSEENLDKSKLTYPLIGGNYFSSQEYKYRRETSEPIQLNNIFSLFGSDLFYYQNENLNEIADNKAKAFLFLQTLPVVIRSLDSFLVHENNLDRSFMIKMSKVEALLIGSMLWRYYKNGKIYQPTDYIFPTETNSYFRINNVFTLNKNSKKDYKWDVCEILPKIYEHTDMGNQFLKLFYEWTNSTEADGWRTILNSLELRTPHEQLLNVRIFNDIAKKYYNDDSYKIESVLSTGFTKNYAYYGPISENLIGLINKDDSYGVRAIIELLFNECIVAYSGDGILKNQLRNVGTSLDYNIVNKIKNGIYENLNKQKDLLKNKGITNSDGDVINSSTLSVIDNEDINLQVYSYLKNIYDKWVSGYKFNAPDSEYKFISSTKTIVNGYETFDFTNFKFIDRSYNNIGDRFIIDYNNILQPIINQNDEKTLYSIITNILGKNQFLFIPMPNYQSWNSAADFAKIFEPIPYTNANMFDENLTSTFICMYTGIPSKRLNIQNKIYAYQNDSLDLNINQNNDIPDDFKSTVEKDALNTENMNVPAFAVSYGKQNQSYFKNISLNQNDPVTTEASINVLRQLNERTDKKSAVTTTSQDIFNLYSDYAYTCSVNMLGCAQIQPMMYFQLTNIPMWNGAYLIYKVNHSIKPGYMSTNFTGMRIGKNYPKLVTPAIITQDKLNLGSTNIEPESKAISTLTLDTKIGKYFTLRDYILSYKEREDAKNKKIETQREVYEYVVSRINNVVSPVIDYIYETWMASENGKKYGKFRINSGYDPTRKNKDSQHITALAADIQLEKSSIEGNTALFEHIKNKMREGLKMDQLIKEWNTKTYETTGGWCHVSPVKLENGIAYVRGESFYLNQNTNDSSNKEIIENAKGSAKLASYESVFNDWLQYWKTAENSNKKGFNKKDNKWYTHESIEGGEPTIAYGIKLIAGSMLTTAMKLMNITQLQNGVIGISEDEAIAEISARAIDSLRHIKPIVETYGKGSFDKLSERAKFGLVDIYLNTGSITGWPNFIQAAISGNVELMIKESHRTNVGNRNDLFAAYLRG